MQLPKNDGDSPKGGKMNKVTQQILDILPEFDRQIIITELHIDIHSVRVVAVDENGQQVRLFLNNGKWEEEK